MIQLLDGWGMVEWAMAFDEKRLIRFCHHATTMTSPRPADMTIVHVNKKIFAAKPHDT